MLPATAETVIIGGGVIGCSVAYQLARRGATGVVVLERESMLGTMSTSKAVGGIRAQFATEINIRLSQISIPFFERFESEMEYPIDFRQWGYLWLVSDAKVWASFRTNAERQRALGVPVELLAPKDAERFVPGIVTDDLVGATYSAKDGFADPNGIVQGFAKQAKRLGVGIHEGVEVTSLRLRNERIAGVVTRDGEIATESVVCCAGAWSAAIGRMAGVEIPIQPFRRQYFVTTPIAGMPPTMPLTIDTKTGVYWKPESGGVLLGRVDPNEPPGFGTSADWNAAVFMVEPAMERWPRLETAEIAAGVAGLYEETPDHHPILETDAGVAGFHVVAGFSGHGIMHSPAAGILMAERLTRAPASFDASALSLRRFAAGNLIHETNVI